MKCTILEISWHNRDPVLSIDLEGKKQRDGVDGEFFWRLATGGADSHVLIWHLSVNETGAAAVTCVSDLTRHQRSVNVVRFSPSGEVLASGDDEAVIILWKRKEGLEPPPLPGEENLNKEQWSSWKVLKGHLEDVYDISWSPDCSMLVSGSVDNTAIVWDAQKGKSTNILQDYKGFVQGVAWDPCNQYIATLSSDRHCRLIDINSMKTVQKVHKAKIPTSPGHALENKVIKIFHDDTFKSFFRRLTFTIDGSMIIAPSGIIESQESTDRLQNATIVFSRHNLKEPIMLLPSLNELTIAVKCCPIYFELRSDGPVALIALPYRLVFAVATQKSVFIYDTQQISPIAVISNIHYTRLTDVVWSSDGRILMVSSTDGYCSIIYFEENELGNVYKANMPIRINTNNQIHQKNQKSQKNAKINEQANKKDIIANLETKEAMDVDVNKFEVIKNIDASKNRIKVQAVKEVKDENKEKDKKNEIIKAKNDSKNVNNSSEKKTDNVGVDIEDTEDIKLVFDVSTSSIDNATDVSNKDITMKSDRTDNDDQDSPPRRITSPKNAQIPILSRTPRRVQLITISSPNRKRASEK